MPKVTHVAKFHPDDAPARILAELTCPACGHVDPIDRCDRIVYNTVRIYCDCCGTFTTVLLSDAQADALRRCSATVSCEQQPSRSCDVR